MPFAYCQKASGAVIRKSHFTRLKKICVQARLPQLIPALTFLEAVALLLSRGEFRTLVELSWLSVKYGTGYLPRRHLHLDYYHQWLRQNERQYSLSAPRRAAQRNNNPMISIIITVHQKDIGWLPDCLQAIINQQYPHWELHLIATGAIMKQLKYGRKNYNQGKDSRIFLFEHPNPHQAVNEVLANVTGEFLVFPASQDLLAPTGLSEVVNLLNRHPETDIIYADEDLIDAANHRSTPFFKPGWSPDLASSMPYTGRCTVYRTSRVKELGGLRAELWPAAQYDLLLRLMEKTNPEKIQHLPKILYHRRSAAGAPGQANEPVVVTASKLALHHHLSRTSQAGEVRAGTYTGTYRLIRELKDTSGVSIIIPFKDKLPLLSQCLDSIIQKTDYPLFELVLVNNQSQEKATYAYLDSLADNPRVRLLDFPAPFNYAAINNRAVEQATYQYILFLNNDTEVISANWLRAMLEHIQRDEVGAVGAKLLYPDHTIQHGGLTIGGGGLLCGDFFRGTPENQAAHVLTQVIRNCSAVTGACLLTKKHLFRAVGGFDEVHLPICYNDVDLCLKLRDRGYLIVWTPYARLYHYESASRSHTPRLAELERLCREQQFFEEKWWALIQNDPYYNPNLSRLFDGYAY